MRWESGLRTRAQKPGVTAGGTAAEFVKKKEGGPGLPVKKRARGRYIKRMVSKKGAGVLATFQTKIRK